MGEFFQLIMDNIFIIILVISGIIGFFSSNKEEQKKQQQQQRKEQQRPRQTEPKPTPTPSGPREPRRPEVYRRTEMEPSEPDVITTASIENEQKSQMEKLQARYGISSSSTIGEDIAHQGLKFRESLKPLDDLSEEKEVLKNDIKQSLRNKGLINGIIMAEVLGKPRSLKPYESVSLERYKR